MRTLASTLIVALVLGLVAFAGVFLVQKRRIDAAHEHLTAFEWFCGEFGVTGELRAEIEALHAEYFPECEEHCIHYADTRETLAEITNDPELDDDQLHADAARRLAELERDADKQFIDFVYRIAAELPEEQSRRYLERMKGWLERAGAAGGDG